jgi:hypothetical protein
MQMVLISAEAGCHVPLLLPARVPHPRGYRVLELTAGLVVILIALTPDLRN